jgi:plastocyanin
MPRYLIALAAVAVVLHGSIGPAAGGPKPATHTITIEGMQFQPATLTVKLGDSIVWVNKDLFPHTATATAGGFDSAQITPGGSWRYRTHKKGEINYVCSLHPTMNAVVNVN